jgi:hypothetical protein
VPPLFCSSAGTIIINNSSNISGKPDWQRSSDLGKTWNTMTLPDDASVYFCFDSSGKEFLAQNNQSSYTKPIGIYASGDHGGEWTAIGVPQVSITALQEGPMKSLLALDYVYSISPPNNWANFKKYYASLDSGHTWSDPSAAFPMLGGLSNSGTIYAGGFFRDRDDGYLFVGKTYSYGSLGTYDAYAPASDLTNFTLQNSYIFCDQIPVCASWGHDIYALFHSEKYTADAALFKTTDHGITWEEIDIPLTATTLQTIAIDDNGALYLGYPSVLYRSDDRSGNWKKIDPGFINAAITYIRFAANTIILATDNQGIWHSSDKGVTWEQWGLGTSQINGVEVSNGICYAATSHGLMSCPLNEPYWSLEYPQGEERAALALLKMSDDRIYFSLDKNGIWTNDSNFRPTVIQHVDPHATAEALRAHFSSAGLTINYTTQRGGQVSFELYDLLGRKLATVAEGYFSVGETMIQKQLTDITAGTYILVASGDGSSKMTKVMR